MTMLRINNSIYLVRMTPIFLILMNIFDSGNNEEDRMIRHVDIDYPPSDPNADYIFTDSDDDQMQPKNEDIFTNGS